jgi:NAD(P)-dependent dehydrogenase (short-subunit alcohol dehydrogenase family)
VGIYVVTGGATGIGGAIKEALRADGHEVIVVDIKEADVSADLSTAEGRDAAIAGIKERAPDGIDGLVTAAGVGAHVPDQTLIVKLNYFGTVDLVSALEDDLVKKQGVVLLVSSESAFNSGLDSEFIEALYAHDEAAACARVEKFEGILAGYTAYAGGKAAIVRWMRHKTAELAAKQVRINAVAPGYTETPLTTEAKSSDLAEVMAEFAKSIPLGRPGVPEDIANGAMFLLSDKATWITGNTLHIDGGHDAMQRPDRVA